VKKLIKFLSEDSGLLGSYAMSTDMIQKYHFWSFCVDQGTATFIGCRPRNREVLQRRMYRTEIGQWMREADLADKQEHSSGRRRDENEHLISSSDQIMLGATLTGEGDSYQRAVPIN
jgi:hypothetical protein